MSKQTKKQSFDELEFTDSQVLEMNNQLKIIVTWRKSMAEQGIKVLALGLTPEEELHQAMQWHQSQTIENDH